MQLALFRRWFTAFVLALATTTLLALASSAAMAQNAPPTYQGDPDVYKVIFEDQNFRVIDAVRKKGVHDKLHSHPVRSRRAAATTPRSLAPLQPNLVASPAAHLLN
jgi:hypothetical protein